MIFFVFRNFARNTRHNIPSNFVAFNISYKKK